MTRPGPSRAAFRRLAWVAAGATLALIALGGVVRISGSGMGCGDDWPLCNGKLFPPLDPPALIEYGHRLAATLVGGLVVGLAALAWSRHRGDAGLRRPASLAAGLLLAQVLLGAVTVRLGLPAWTVVLHLATGMLLLAALMEAGLRAGERGPAGGAVPAPDSRPLPVVRAAAGLAFGVILLGGLVANLDAGAACRGFPLCNGTLLPEGGSRVALHWLHRLLAFALVGLLAAAFAVGRGRNGGSTVVSRLSAAALALGLLQVGIAAAMVLRFLPPGLRAAHLVVGTLVWASLVALCHHAGRPAAVPARAGGASPRVRSLAAPAAQARSGRLATAALRSASPRPPAGLPLPPAGAGSRMEESQ